MQVTKLVERGRVVFGPLGSPPDSGPNGAFLVVCPASGRELTIIASDGAGWLEGGMPPPVWEHVSVSTPKPKQTPSWAEMDWVRQQFWGLDTWVIQFHPAEEKKVNFHPGCLHMWRPLASFPVPPQIAAGPP